MSSNAKYNADTRLSLRRRQFFEFFQHRTGARWTTRAPDIPLAGQPPDVVLPTIEQTAFPYYRSGKGVSDLDAHADASTLAPKSRLAFDNLQTLKDYFAGEYPQIHYSKCLGFGGNGLAAAFNVFDKNGNRQPIVVKVIFQDDEATLKKETDAHDEGLVKLGAKPKLDADGDEEMDEWRYTPIHTFMMEMLECGDLAQLISRVKERGENFPGAMLWRLCLCFVRMCIALAYPPNNSIENQNREGPIRETVPRELRDEPGRWTHFDFDPKNIFVGDINNDGEHDVTPTVKLGDFGLALEVQRGRGDFYYEKLRQRAKKYFMAPEQFCVDWDYIRRDEGFVGRHPIAGNFGSHTNVWAVMECLITQCYPAWPPHPTATSRMPPTGKEWYYTYAGHLEQQVYSHVPREMIGLISRLQAHLPEDRPKLFELEEYVTTMIRQQATGDERESRQLADWFHEVLWEPREAPPEPVGMENVWRDIVGTGLINQLPPNQVPRTFLLPFH
ncbi:hypothetical protein O1611_g9261 [Lasiodiplodia mahajangana]|uniref:Uncharacterized protein n=1 Tax=Lasiodiplodia mahajangana TaxID=1108764 RepID=A0ACC2JAH2_9PEZI|nr:hypothetical protein O1611_g9261 [Lasiodiplodia mahajangana]